MGLRKLSQFETQLQFALGNRGFDPTELQYWINTGLEDLCGTQQFEDLITVFSGTVAANMSNVTVTAPSDVVTEGPDLEGVIEMFNATDDILMTKVDKARFDLLEPGVTGQPQHWYRQGITLLVWPQPESVCDIRGQALAAHPVLEAPDDTTILLRGFDRAVHLLAMFHALTDLEEPNRAAFFLQASSRYVDKLTTIDDIEGRATGEPLQPIETRAQLQRQRTVSNRYR